MTSYWHCLLFLWEPEAFKQAMRVKSSVRCLMSWSTGAVWWVYGQALFSNLQATSSFLQADSITKALWILTALNLSFSVLYCCYCLPRTWYFGFICGGTCVTSAESLQLAKLLFYKAVKYKTVCCSTECECVCGRTCVFMKVLWLHIVLDRSHSIIQHTSPRSTIRRPGLLFSFIVFRPILLRQTDTIQQDESSSCQHAKGWAMHQKENVRSQSRGFIEKRKSGWKFF